MRHDDTLRVGGWKGRLHTRQPNRRHQPLHGFTIIELLVVVTIIVILLAVLLPSLDKATAVAEKADCLGNLKAFSAAYRLYSQDHKGDVIYITGTRGNYWQHRLAPYLGQTGFGKDGPDDGAPDFMVCASTQITTAGGTSENTWYWQGVGYGSYGFNLWLTNYVDYTGDTARFPASYWHLKFDSANGQTPIMGDGTWVGSWPGDQDIDPGNYESGNGTHETGYFMGRFCIDRHGGFTTNLCFVDGSARNMILGELWQVPWHRKFNPHYKEGGWD